MCGYLCIEFIDFILKGKSLLDYTNSFYLNKYEMNDKILIKYLQLLKRLRWKKSIVLFVPSIKTWKTL